MSAVNWATGRQTVDEIVARRARAWPARVAVCGSGETLTYGDLNARANQVAHHLRKLGVRDGDIVGVYAERSTAAIIMLLGVLKAGAAYLALDQGYSAERRRLILSDAGIDVVLTTANLAPELSRWCNAVYPDQDELAELPATAPPTHAAAASTAYVAYTSGSTGRPKGICIPHRAVLRLALDPDFVSVRDEDVFLQFAPIAFDASTLELWGPLLAGARLVVAPPGDVSLRELAGLIRDAGVTVLWLTAGLFHRMVETGLDDLRGLRYLLAGGDVLSPALVDRAVRALPDTVVVNGYGPTENTTFTCCHAVSGPRGTGKVPIGRPIRDTEVYPLDERLRPVADGEAGELYAAGAGLAHGYLGRSSMTAAHFVANPFATTPGERMYRTGDFVRRLPDGNLEFLGRRDSQVKVRGFRIELGEVETAVAALPGIAEAAVVARGQPSGDRHLVAYVVGVVGAEPSTLDIRRRLAEELPEYAVPALVRVVEALPLTASGKLDRMALEARDAPDRPEQSSAYREPATPRESAIARLWSDHLGIAGIGADDDFFELGGHSLLAVTIIEQLRREYGVEVSPMAFYLDPTPSGLAVATESSTAVL